MNTSLATRPAGTRATVVVGFYLITFLIGGFFLFAGGSLRMSVYLTATAFYIVVTVLFYALNKDASNQL